MEIHIMQADQGAEIDVHCPAETVPAGEAIFLFALDVRERITKVLKIKADAAFQ